MDIVGHENYLIYPDGRVWSKWSKGRFLKPAISTHGYFHVSLCNKGKQKTHKIHRLIALYYIPNPENKLYVDHINRIKTDNRLENLRWATNSENQQNTGISKNNTTGMKNISYNKLNNVWVFKKTMNKKKTQISSKSKRKVLCCKFAFIILNIKC
tara:strand:+ start:269 stop:733 length:465 start_codon:yes stop_codon:yes gene_type:complete